MLKVKRTIINEPSEQNATIPLPFVFRKFYSLLGVGGYDTISKKYDKEYVGFRFQRPLII